MNQEKIGRFISILRKEKNMTQEELASKLGVSNKTISRWERGINLPDLSLLKELSKEFNVTINDLLSGEIIEDKDLKNLEKNLIDYTDLNLKRMTTKAKIYYLAEEITVAIISSILAIIIYRNFKG